MTLTARLRGDCPVMTDKIDLIPTVSEAKVNRIDPPWNQSR